jgi:PAS domain S-box-containing protein/putative nucleotidyltransferase with HDIG domain
MAKEPASKVLTRDLIAENEELRARLDEVEDTLRAIRSGEVDALIIAGTDGEQIFTLKQAEEKIHLQAGMLESVNDAIVASDTQYRLTVWNAAAESLYGWKAVEVLGKNGLKFLRTEWPTNDGESMRRVIAESGRWRGEATQVCKDGSRIHVELSTVVLHDSNGQITGYVSMNRDISARKHAEQLMQNFNNASMEAERALSHKDIFNALRSELKKLDFACMIFLVENNESLIPQYLSYPSWLIIAAEKLAGIKKEEYKIKITDTALYQRVVHKQETCFIPDVVAELNMMYSRSLIKLTRIIVKALDIHTMISAPVIVDGKVIAVFSVQSKTLTEKDTPIVAAFANQVAASWHKAELYEKAQLEIDQRKHGEVTIRRQLEHLSAVSTIDRVITSIFDLKLSLTEILHHVTNELDIDAADIYVLDADANMLDLVAEHGFSYDSGRKARIQLGESYVGRAALERKLVRIKNLSREPKKSGLTTLMKGEKFVCYFGVPLIIKGHVKGVLEVFDRAALDPDKEWFDFLNTLAGQVAIAIEISTLFESLERSNSEITQAYDATIEGWSHALDLRDKETEGHTLRVTEMAGKLASKFGLGEAELVQVRWGALLHDIGKMGVPDEILHKPGPLTDEEWEKMKKHPTFAYEMLAPIRYLLLAQDIPYCHHEKWDGSGYPRGLKGTKIPLAARIFAVVDVWDALNSDRPYRKAWEQGTALEYIHALSGTHFDPDVVNVFMKFLKNMFEGSPQAVER